MPLTANDYYRATQLLSRFRRAPPAGQIDWPAVERVVALYRGRGIVRVWGISENVRNEFARCTGITLNLERVAKRTCTWYAQPWEVFIGMRLCQAPARLPPKRPVIQYWISPPVLCLPRPEHDAAGRCVKCGGSHLRLGGTNEALRILQCLGL